MDKDLPINQNPRSVNVANCPNVIIGDNNVINVQNWRAQGTESFSGNGDLQHAAVHLHKPFHVSCVRRKELNEIESLFSSMPDENAVKSVFLTGPPGAGKTELARQYGDHFSKSTSTENMSVPVVITLNAKSKESLLKSVKEVTQRILVTELKNENLVELFAKLRNYLHTYNGVWLLIIDDMLENNDFNHAFPQSGSTEWGAGQVLITSQDNNVVPACHQFAKKFSLDEGMTEEDSRAVLTEISGVETDEYAEEIIKKLHGLPLALACCATFVGETRQDRASTNFGWEEYLGLYNANPKLESRAFFNNNTVYPRSMTTASLLAVSRVSETSDVLRLTFSFLSYCALLPVPLKIVANYVSENLPEHIRKRRTTSEIENEISRCTLLVHGRSQNVETIKCHQVIYHAFQDVENKRPVEQREVEFVKMMQSLNETLDFMDNFCKNELLLKVLARPHLQLFVNHANDMSWNNSPEFVLISMKNGQFFFSTSDMPEEKVVKSLESLYNLALELDLTDERRCDILANLGFYYLELGRDEDARNFLSKAYYMTEEKYGSEWLKLKCRISYNLARTYVSMDSVDLGVEMMKKSIELAKTVYINEKDKIMNRYFWLANFHLSPMKIWNLRKVVNDATEFFSSCPPDSLSLNKADCLFQLSLVHFHYGVIQFIFMPQWFPSYLYSAEKLLNQSMNMYKQILGEDISSCDHILCPMLLCAIIDIASNQQSDGEELLEKALEMAIQSSGKYYCSLMTAYKKHLVDYVSWSEYCYRRIRNLSRGCLTSGVMVNILDDIVEDCNSGRILPSRRIVDGLKTARSFLVWYDCVVTFAYISLLVLLLYFSIRLFAFYSLCFKT